MSIGVITLVLAATLGLAPTEADGTVSDPKVVKQMHAYAACMAEHREAPSRALLAMDFRTDGYSRALKRFDRGGHCGQHVERSMRGNGLLLAGGLAEGLLRKDLTLSALAVRTAYNPSLPNIEARNAGEFLSFCAVRKDPAGIVRLLGSEPASAQEADAMRGMSGTLSGCVPANSKSSFTREALRSLLALGAYRLALHNSQNQAAN